MSKNDAKAAPVAPEPMTHREAACIIAINSAIHRGRNCYPDDAIIAPLIEAAKLFADATPPAASAPTVQPLTEQQVWKDDEIMSRNAVGGLPMHDLMRLVRAIERAHGITAAPTKETP